MENKVFIVFYEYNDYKSGDSGNEFHVHKTLEGAKKKFEKLYKEKVEEAFTPQEQEDFDHYYRSEKCFEVTSNRHGYSNSCVLIEKEIEE